MSDITPTTEGPKTLRERLLSKGKEQAKPESGTLFGESIELRRPSLERIVQLQDQMQVSTNASLATAIIWICYDPTTGEPLFTAEDASAIMLWQFDDELRILVERITTMIGLNVKVAEKNSEATLSDTSS